MLTRYKEDLKLAIRHLQIADHMTYVTYPLVNEKRLLLKVLEEINLSMISSINCMFNYGHPEKPINLKKDEESLEKALKEVSKEYSITNEQIIKIKEVFVLNKKHKKSGMEFVKKDKIIILSDSLDFEAINLQKIKEYILLTKRMIVKITLKLEKR